MKKEKLNYFDEFAKNMQFAVEETALLKEIIEDFSKEKVSNNLNNMHQIEHNADINKHNLMEYLLKDFIPPIEREDIVELSHKIDNVTDNIEEILINFYMFDIGVLKPEIDEYIDLLVRCCESCNNLIIELKNYKKSKIIFDIIVEINNLEGEGDNLFMENMRKLHLEDTNANDIIIWTKIFDCFEKCYDSFEQVSDCVETIILKNS